MKTGLYRCYRRYSGALRQTTRPAGQAARQYSRIEHCFNGVSYIVLGFIHDISQILDISNKQVNAHCCFVLTYPIFLEFETFQCVASKCTGSFCTCSIGLCANLIELDTFTARQVYAFIGFVLANVLIYANWQLLLHLRWITAKFRKSHQLSLHFNPFDTKPMAKIAVKMSIMRVVKFMSS